MFVKSEVISDTLYIEFLSNKIDILNKDLVGEEIFSRLEKEKPVKLVLNMNRVDYIDSSGIGLLASIRLKTKESGLKISISNVSENTRRLLKITKISDMFETEDYV